MGTRPSAREKAQAGLTNHPDSRVGGTQMLMTELKLPLRRGLPAETRHLGDVLPNLRGVIRRCVHPDHFINRADTCNELLVRIIKDLDHDRYGQPARILFAIAPGMRGTTLTVRRQHAATHLGYDLDHFRKRIEPEILRLLAEQLYRDHLRYQSRITNDPASDDRRPNPFDLKLHPEELTNQEELAARIWQYHFALRAELIAYNAGLLGDGEEIDRETHRLASVSLQDRLSELVTAYSRLYGRLVPMGNVNYPTEGFLRPLQHSGASSAGKTK